MYRNEAEVGEAIRASGVPREEVFVSAWEPLIPCRLHSEHAYDVNILATKIESKDHGYESTLKGVDESLKRFGFGKDCSIVGSGIATHRTFGRLYRSLLNPRPSMSS